MKQIKALFQNWEHTNKDSKCISRKWEKVVGAIEHQKDEKAIYTLIVEYAAETDFRAFR